MLMRQNTTAELAGRTVLIRANFENGVTPALGALISRYTRAGARVAVIGGYGDPCDDVNPALSLACFVETLSGAAGCPVTFIGESVGAGGEAGLDRIEFGEAALLENLRFHGARHRDARSFALKLSVLADFFVDMGAAPADPKGWPTQLRSLLPEPPFAQSTNDMNEEA